jgi:hypothetical protein
MDEHQKRGSGVESDPPEGDEGTTGGNPFNDMSDEDAQREAENDQEQPRTVTHRVKNAIEDLIPGDSDGDGH